MYKTWNNDVTALTVAAFCFLQERQSEGCKEIPRVISSLYVNIIQNIMGNPPDLTVLKAVCEFLIAVHPTDDITRLHAPSRCYLREHSLDFGMLTRCVLL